MSSAFIEQKMKALETVTTAYRAFQEALRELPLDWQKEILAELENSGPATPIPSDKPPEVTVTAIDNTELMMPTDAVRAFLTAHPQGEPARVIVKTLAGKIRTTSANPNKLLYSVLLVLRRAGHIEKLPDKRYRLVVKPPHAN